jgi:hypothetical protein
MQQNQRKTAFEELTIPVPQNISGEGEEIAARASGGRLFAVCKFIFAIS